MKALSMNINVGIKTSKGFLALNSEYPAVVKWLNDRYQSKYHLPKDGTELPRQGLKIVSRSSNDTEINVVVEEIPR